MFGAKGNRRRLGFESLERRELLAGNVNAGLDVNGNIVLTGDADHNHVVVYRGFFGQILVEGGTSDGQASGRTRVNGSFGAVGFNTRGGVIVSMGNGNDRVLLTNVAMLGNVTGSLGVGNDRIGLHSDPSATVPFTMNDFGAVPYGNYSLSGSVIINGQGNNDTLSLFDVVVAGNVTFDGGNGNDVFVQNGVDVDDNTIGGTATIRGGNDDDTVNVRRLAVGGNFIVNDASARTRSSINLVNLRVNLDIRLILTSLADNVVLQGEDNGPNRFQARTVVINTFEAADTVQVSNGIMTNLRINTGTGNEGGGFFGVQVTNVTAGNQVFVDTGPGLSNLLLDNIRTDSLRVFTGDQSDGVIAQNMDVANAFFDTGESDDVVGLHSSVYDFLVVNLLGGDDQLHASGLTVTVRAEFNGGAGVNTYFDQGGNSYNRLIRRNI